jgi:DNA-binding beta-propeller fold protein YncE
VGGALRRILVSGAVLALLAGCATSEPKVLHLGMNDTPDGRRITFPPAPDVPRYAYVGELVGEHNFRPADGSEGGGVKGFVSWLVGLGDEANQRTVLQRPQSGAVDATGRILVTDVSRGAVYVFDEAAGELQVWDKAEGLKNFTSPTGIALGPDGTFFVADAELGLVARLDKKGEPLPAWGKGVFKRPTGLAYDGASGRLYVADTYDHNIKVLDANGQLTQTISRRGEAPGELNYPTYLALSAGELLVADTMNGRVQAFDPYEGMPVRQVGRRGLFVGEMVRPKGVAADTSGNVYVVESYYDHLLIYSRGGDFLMPIGGLGATPGRFYLPAGVWTDGRDRIFVADTFNGRVVVLQFLGGDGDE